MPYWYYQLLRIFGTIGFAYLAWWYHQTDMKFLFLTFLCSAIILNPIIKISFSRDIWQVVDVILALVTSVSVILEKRLSGKRSKSVNK